MNVRPCEGQEKVIKGNNCSIRSTFLPVFQILLECTDEYVEHEDCQESQALISPEQQLTCLLVQQLQSE